MSDSPPHDSGDGAVLPPVKQSQSFDVESLLSELRKTEAGADGLAKALKDRHTREVLKQRGVTIQADDDVGYKSLPPELREHIRTCAIASVTTGENVFHGCERCPRLALYACIDSEWQKAVEPVTFQRLRLRQTTEDLELLERYVVGIRRQYLQRIYLPVDSFPLIDPIQVDIQDGESSLDHHFDAFTSPIRQLFKCLEKWHERGTGDDKLQVELQAVTITSWVAIPPPLPSERLHAEMTNLPTTPQITHFCVSLCEPMDAKSLLALFSHMPNLRSAAITLRPSAAQGNDPDYPSQIQSFFDSLSQTVPKLQALEVKGNNTWGASELRGMLCTAALSFSQKLCKFSLEDNHASPRTNSFLEPFSTARFDPDTPPLLMWPDLTDFTITRLHVQAEEQNHIATGINEMMLRIGRAIRHMPRIQNLGIMASYIYQTEQDGDVRMTHILKTDICFSLETVRNSPGHRPLAILSVTHYNVTQHSTGLDLTDIVPSEEVRDLWQDSLLHSANAVLEVEVNQGIQGQYSCDDVMSIMDAGLIRVD